RRFTGTGWEGPSGSGNDLVDDSFENSDPRVALGPQGFPIVVWSGFDGNRSQIFARRDGGFGFAEMGPDSADGPGISDAPFEAFAPHMAAPPTSGGVGVVWLTDEVGVDPVQVYFRQFSTAPARLLRVSLTGTTDDATVISTPVGIDCPGDSC